MADGKIQFIQTPEASQPPIAPNETSVCTTNISQNNKCSSFLTLVIGLGLFECIFGGGFYTYWLLVLVWFFPIFLMFWTITSSCLPRLGDIVHLPNLGAGHYSSFKGPKLTAKYTGDNKISMETFHELCFDNKVDFKADALEILDASYDLADFNFKPLLFRFFLTGMIPEVITHS